MTEPIAWQNGYGHTYWQPALDTGHVLWIVRGYDDTRREWLRGDVSRWPYGYWPKVYRSRNRAIRVARREEKRRLRDRLARLERVE